MPFSSPSTVCRLLAVTHCTLTKPPRLANHPDQLPQGSESIRSPHVPAHTLFCAQEDKKKPLPSKQRPWSSCPLHCTASPDLCALYLGTDMSWGVLEWRNHEFFPSSFWSPTVCSKLGRGSACWSVFAYTGLGWIGFGGMPFFFFFLESWSFSFIRKISSCSKCCLATEREQFSFKLKSLLSIKS